MDWRLLGLHSVAVLVYPGAAFTLLAGLLSEAMAARVLKRLRSARTSNRRSIRGAVRSLLEAPPLAVAAGLMGVLASTQLSIPFNPVSGDQRNILVAAAALLSAAWTAWTWGWRRRRVPSGLLLGVQCCWLLALFVPALVEQTLRPQTLGTVLVPTFIPLKVAAAALYLLCLPVLIELVADSAPAAGPEGAGPGPEEPLNPGFGAARAVLWAPYCGLWASVYLRPQPDTVAGLAIFVGASSAVALFTIALAAWLARRGGEAAAATTYRRVLGAAAANTLIFGLVASFSR